MESQAQRVFTIIGRRGNVENSVEYLWATSASAAALSFFQMHSPAEADLQLEVVCVLEGQCFECEEDYDRLDPRDEE